MAEALVKIGQITAPHGLNGEVRVYPLTDFPERFTSLRQVLLGPEARPVGMSLRGTQKNVLILQIDGVTDVEGANRLRQQYLQVPLSEVHPLPEGHHYVFDLIGLKAVDPEGQPLGKLIAVEATGPGHDIYVLETASGEQRMVPAVREFVKAINLDQGQIVIQPIPGLLD
jgi:16S rRNA processing protein RimM